MGRNDAVSIKPSTWGQSVPRSITPGRTHYQDTTQAKRKPTGRQYLEVELEAADFEQPRSE
jgi:hypothetical protein